MTNKSNVITNEEMEKRIKEIMDKKLEEFDDHVRAYYNIKIPKTVSELDRQVNLMLEESKIEDKILRDKYINKPGKGKITENDLFKGFKLCMENNARTKCVEKSIDYCLEKYQLVLTKKQ
jgi:hypothetical protein